MRANGITNAAADLARVAAEWAGLLMLGRDSGRARRAGSIRRRRGGDDVARVLAALGKGWDGDDRVFARSHDKAAKRFRAWRRTAGCHRPELFECTDSRRPIRVHDLRAAFIALAFAAGWSKARISDRTGRKSSQMINGYRRAARTASEPGLGELLPLDECVPELCPEALGVHRERAWRVGPSPTS